MSDITHYEGCWQDPRHHACALTEIERLREEKALRIGWKGMVRDAESTLRAQADEIERLRAQLQTHVVANLKLSDEIERLHGLLREAEQAYEGNFRIDVDEWMVRVRDALPKQATEER